MMWVRVPKLLAIVTVLGIATPSLAADLTPEELAFFETKIRPVLIKECYGCHSNKAGNVRGGLRLDTRQLTHIGGSSGPAVVPGDPELSLLYTAITHEDFVMPPKRKLSDEVIADFRKWIEMGAPDPRENKVTEIKPTVTPEDIHRARENFWAYQSPQVVTPPAFKHSDWVKTDIDRFVLAKLDEAGLAPAADADSYKVLRRICFDLVGLPPTPEQIEYFSQGWERDPDAAITHVVDQLLESERFGERWGRHWLDVARYAESTGREVNMTYPHAWRYRDYVIDAFNNDKPFDEFVQEQIAGDLLPASSDDEWTEHLIATSFLAIGPKNVNEQNALQFRMDVIDEQIDATTRVFLGTSVACARCHDHKFDAIPQADYYALAGIFGSTTTYFGNPPSEYGNLTGVQARRTSSLLLLPVEDPNPYDKTYSESELADLKEEIETLRRELSELRFARNNPNDSGRGLTALQQRLRLNNQLAELSAKLAVVDANGQPRSYCMGVQETEVPRDGRLLVRGEIDQVGPSIPRGFPQALCQEAASIPTSSSGRLELARWIGSQENPLTARVMVNRIWQHLIGQGLVTSTENFGVTGQPPSHPELLDHLALQFVDSNWSVKSIIREIIRSRVYRISSQYDDRSFQYDPDNQLVWRANPRRLDAEAIRDAMLSISGELDFDRPRGSEVAKAGYTRVRDGILGDPREVARQAAESMRAQMAAGGGFGGRGGFGAGRGMNQGRGFAPGRGFGPQGRGNDPNAGDAPGRGFGPGRFAIGGRGPAGNPSVPGGMQNMFAAIADKVQNQLDMQDAKFRSVYLPIVRDEVPRSLEVFDFAEASSIVGTRESSNTANQALYMMNNPFVIGQSDALARRISREEEQLDLAFLLTYGRPPTPGERTAATKFLQSFAGDADRSTPRGSGLSALCQSLFASAEFRYID